MKIRNVLHKGLRRFIASDDTSGLPTAVVPKLRRIVSFLQDMEREDELRTVPSWKASFDRGPQGRVESVCHEELAPDVHDRSD